MLRVAAKLVNTPFQEKVKRAVSGKHKGCAIKSYTRMYNKTFAAEDHRYMAKPRPATNIDIVRCCVTFKTVAALRKGVAALVRAFGNGCGGVGRVKNGFALREKGVAAQSFFIIAVS